MSTLVRRSGIVTAQNFWGTRNVFTLSNGTCVAVVQDNNATTAQTNYGDKSGSVKFHIYSSTDRATWTLRASQVLSPSGVLTCNVAYDDTIGIYMSATNKSGYYWSVNTTTWAVTATQVVHGALASTETESDCDLTFTEGNVPVVSTLRKNTTGTSRLTQYTYCRRTSDNAWVYSTNPINLTASNNPKSAYQTCSFLAVGGGDAATTRRLVYAIGSGYGTTDNGVQIYTAVLNETTGLLTAAPALRETVAKGMVPSNSVAGASRNAMLFSSDDAEYSLGVQHYEGNRAIGFTRGTWDGTTWTRVTPWSYYNLGSTTKIIQYNMTMTYSSDRIAYHMAVGAGELMTSIGLIDSDTNKITFRAANYWDNRARTPCYGLLGGTGTNTDMPMHDVIFLHRPSLTSQAWYHHYARPSIAPKNVVPSGGQVIADSTPVLQARADLDVKYAQSRIRLRWEFASDSSFTTNYREYEQDIDKLKLVNNTDVANAFVPFSDNLPGDLALTQGNWYVRAAHVDEFDVVGAYSPVKQFSIYHPPSAASIQPNSSKTLLYTGSVAFSWKFSDSFPLDTQTAYEIEISSNVDGALVADTGKVISTSKTPAVLVGTAFKDIVLQARVKLWDLDDAEGPWSGYVYFRTSDAPIATITSLTNNQIINTAVPQIQTQATFSGDRKIVSGRIIIKKGSTKVHDSGLKPLNLYNGDMWTYVPPIELLANNTAYRIESYLTDSGGLTSAAGTVNVTTTWTTPAPASSVGTNTGPYNTEGQGYVALTWSDANRDADFSAWNVWRRIDYYHPSTGALLETGTWEKIASVTNPDTTYTYKDYWAKSGYRVNYKVEQEVIRFGDVVVSTTAGTVFCNPISESYWVIQPDTEEAFQLGGVTGDSYTDEYEEDDFVIPGRGRHMDVGERLGFKGTLDAQVRDSSSMTARQRKLRLERIKAENRKLYLRNPFGDIFRVGVQSMTYTRIAGVGLSEFFDLSIPYMEVGSD